MILISWVFPYSLLFHIHIWKIRNPHRRPFTSLWSVPHTEFRYPCFYICIGGYESNLKVGTPTSQWARGWKLNISQIVVSASGPFSSIHKIATGGIHWIPMSFILADLLILPPFCFPARWISCFGPLSPLCTYIRNPTY